MKKITLGLTFPHTHTHTHTQPLKALAVAAVMSLSVNYSTAQNNVITQVWLESTGVQSGVFGAPTTIDASDNLYRAGFEKLSNGGTMAKLQKIDNEGQLEWTADLNPTGTITDKYEPSKVVVNGSDIYMAGIVTYTTSGESDFFISKVNQSGILQWLTIEQESGNDVAADMMYDATTSQIYICGTTERNGDYDMLLAAYSDGGSEQWLVAKDYNGNADVGAKIYRDGSNIVIQGSSQNSPVDWDIASWFYTDGGSYISHSRTTGLNAASDELKDGAMQNNHILLTGKTTSGSNTSFKVVCLDANNNLLWQDTYSKNANAEEGLALTPISNGFVATGYVTASPGNEDILIRKYDLNGNALWSREMDVDGANDRGVDIIEDSEGNYIVISDVEVNGQTDVYMHYLEASTGNELWSTAVAQDAAVYEKALSIEVAFGGEIYVTYENDGQAVTESYSYSEVDFPMDNESFSRGSFIIANGGQLRDDNGQVVTDVRYYTFGQHPEMYYSDDRMSVLVVNQNTNQVQRIDYDFVNATGTHVGQLAEYEKETHFNYYKGIAKYEQQGTFDVLAYPELYPNINAFISSNSAGFKMTFVLENGADLNDIEVDINGSSGFNLSGGNLEVSTIADPINWLEPYSYPQNDEEKENDECIQYYLSEGNLKFVSGCGELSYPYVVTIRSGVGAAYGVSSIGNMDWSTFYGGDDNDVAYGVATSSWGDIYVGGLSASTILPDPNSPGGVKTRSSYPTSGVIIKFNSNFVIKWVTFLPDESLVKAIALYDNLSSNNLNSSPEEVHFVGELRSSFSPYDGISSYTPSIPSPFQKSFHLDFTGGTQNLQDGFFGTLDPYIGVRQVVSSYGGEGPTGIEHIKEMEIVEVNGTPYMYFVGSTDASSSANLSSQNPPVFPDERKIPVYNPNDGSYFNTSNSTGAQQGFVAAVNLNNYKLAYSSLIPTFKSINDISFGQFSAFCGEGGSGGKVGRFDPSSSMFASNINQTNSDFSNLNFFTAVISDSKGNTFFGLNSNRPNSTKSIVTNPQYQNPNGESYIVHLNNRNPLTVDWDTYFGETNNQETDQAGWWGTLNTTLEGAGNLAYNQSLSTIFAVAQGSDHPVETQPNSSFFYESTIGAGSNNPDTYIAAFSDNYYGDNFHSWGTMYGGPDIEMANDVVSYDYNGSSYIVVVGASISDEGTKTSDVNKFPVADAGGYFQQDNITKSSSGFADMVISRFKIQGVNISTDEYDVNKQELKIYPNPTKSMIYIGRPPGGFISIKVMDIQGKVVIEKGEQHLREVETNYSLRLDNLSDGIYIINVNEQYNAKVIKK
ncbi:T9SS type A sorting domain-containing protein [Owenweeksia hongkongensis]|uniref:DUF7948 domain-containing protein n=1 Tax=Owenweeksia hongkongensis TaxID=253245 RepID=UPI003A91CCA7